jgi:hypothetical protein
MTECAGNSLLHEVVGVVAGIAKPECERPAGQDERDDFLVHPRRSTMHGRGRCSVLHREAADIGRRKWSVRPIGIFSAG